MSVVDNVNCHEETTEVPTPYGAGALYRDSALRAVTICKLKHIGTPDKGAPGS